MGPRCSSALGRGPPPGRRRGETGPQEPPLQGAHGGRCLVGMSVSEHHADQSRPPTRVLAAQAQGRLHEGFRGLRCRGPATVIGGHHSGLPPLTEAADQVADGARGEAEGRSNGGAILTVQETPPDGLAYGD